MGRWHYQVMKYDLWDDAMDFNDTQVGYGIHEYYELETGDTWTQEPVPIAAESVEELKAILQDMLLDIDKHGVKDFDVYEDDDEYNGN